MFVFVWKKRFNYDTYEFLNNSRKNSQIFTQRGKMTSLARTFFAYQHIVTSLGNKHELESS